MKKLTKEQQERFLILETKFFTEELKEAFHVNQHGERFKKYDGILNDKTLDVKIATNGYQNMSIDKDKVAFKSCDIYINVDEAGRMLWWCLWSDLQKNIHRYVQQSIERKNRDIDFYVIHEKAARGFDKESLIQYTQKKFNKRGNK